MNDFENYQNAKRLLNFEYKGFALNRVLALEIWQFANGNLPFRLKQIARIFLAYSFKDLLYNPNEHSILSTFGVYKRKDHLETYDNILSLLGPSVARNVMMNPQKCFHFSLGAISFVFHHYSPLLSNKGLKGANSKIALFFELIFWCNTIDRLKSKNICGVKKYLSFCDSLDLENLLTQFFKIQGVPTYSLTHGTHHIIYKAPEPGMLGYENMETDHLLLWGQYSVDEYEKWGIAKKRLHLAGYPKANKLIKVKPNQSYKRCVVLLSQHYFFALNMKLLEFLIDYVDEYDFTIKPHPAAIEYYKDFATKHGMEILDSNTTIEQCLTQERYDWCIAVNTGAYYEALMRGVRCLRFSDGSFDLQPGCSDVFENKAQFDMKVKDILYKPYNLYQEEVNDALTYAYGVGINNYREIILNS